MNSKPPTDIKNYYYSSTGLYYFTYKTSCKVYGYKFNLIEKEIKSVELENPDNKYNLNETTYHNLYLEKYDTTDLSNEFKCSPKEFNEKFQPIKLINNNDIELGKCVYVDSSKRNALYEEDIEPTLKKNYKDYVKNQYEFIKKDLIDDYFYTEGECEYNYEPSRELRKKNINTYKYIKKLYQLLI
jgi:hypothetical protein